LSSGDILTKATRAGINLGQLLARSPTVSRSMSGGLRDARYLSENTIADAVTDGSSLHHHRPRAALDHGLSDSRHDPIGSADSLYDLHRSIGAAVIPLVILRLIYRWTHSPLPLPEDIPAMQRLTAHVTHWGLYALLIVQPLTGWIATSAYRAPVIVFGWFELPPIWPENRAFCEQLFSVHSLIGIAIACLAAAHIGAALYHHFVRKDRILMRMISG
jgi:cytochrome b561